MPYSLCGGGLAIALVAVSIALVNRDTAPLKQPSWNFGYDPELGVGANVCSIKRIKEQDLTADDFLAHYWRQKPIILQRSPSVNQAAQQWTTKHRLLQEFGTRPVRLATYESYAFREKETEQVFSDYLEQLQAVSANQTTANTSYAFGADPYHVGDRYAVPQVIQQLRDQLHLEWHFQVAVAASGGGLAFHWHADVFAETLHGRRRWFLVSPKESPVFHPRETTAKWLIRQLQKKERSLVMECAIGPNEAIYVPADWFHATLSLGEAVSITTSFAQTFRKDFREQRSANFENGAEWHIRMLDALGERDYAQAIEFGKRLVKSRPKNFVSHGWLGIILTLYAQSLGAGGKAFLLQNSMHQDLEEHIVDTLQAARASTKRCTELNPLYAPCHVWLMRQCRALIKLTEEQKAYQELLAQAKQSQSTANLLGNEEDDEMLDPRWRPKSNPI